MIARPAAFAVALMLVSGCRQIASYRADDISGGKDARADRGVRGDGEADIWPDSLHGLDAIIGEGSAPDGSASEGPPPDTATPDIAASDIATPDARPADASPKIQDGPKRQGCAAGTTMTILRSTMLHCKNAGANFKQCQAKSKLCGAGWHLCTAKEYRNVFAKRRPPQNLAMAWIASCVRLRGKLQAPSDTICGDCTNKVVRDVAVAWSCSTSTAVQSSMFANLGIASPQSIASSCKRAGKIGSTGAHWLVSSTSTVLSSALCCR